MQVTLLYFEGCPNWKVADERLQELSAEFGLTVTHKRVETSQEAEDAGFRGSPTILIDGLDPFASGGEPVGLACRLYQTPEGPAGYPTMEQLREVLVSA